MWRRQFNTGTLLACMWGAFPCFAFSEQQPSLILISIDTLRANHLGCYGDRRARTPGLDALAREGTLFSRIETPVPLTLPAHTSLLTSTYPFTHGVEENGEQAPAGAVTLAAVLRDRGYATAAFAGGYVLDARFGLTSGFDIYDSPFHLGPDFGEEPPEVKRSAEAVFAAARQWIAHQPGRPLFAFIHLYDAHQPYSHGAYDNEIAYIDEQFRGFTEFLAAQGRLGNAVIAVTADHGESLGEHGEQTHGYFIYESTLWVPLVIRWPAAMGRQPRRIDDPGSLIDVAPTLLHALGVAPPPRFQGHSLLRRPPGEEAIYAESMYARDHLGCSALRAIRFGRYKYIDAPKPELYDLTADPGETRNLYDRDRSRALALRGRLGALEQRGRQPHRAASDEAATSGLRSLGYLAGAPSGAGSGADPKDRLREYEAYGRAIRFSNAGRFPDAIRELRTILGEDGGNRLARFYLAVCYYRLRRLDDAIEELKAVQKMYPAYAPAQQLLGTIWLVRRDYGRARRQFEELAAIAPGNFGAHYNLGILAMREGRREDAIRELQAAVRADPGSTQARAALDEVEGQNKAVR
ncbi:MAG TPA: sulfatase-like hydrolase/transferase [Bryobacteraceae bacterium]|nr:sulfatase-like hydrolase/transferase [Bryobacteraceae bacterium]